MSFIDAFDALPPDDNAGRIGLFFQALRTDWRALFAELRRRRPILDMPLFLVLSRWSDVVDVLSRPGTFQVTYGPRMDPSVGPFMLGHDNSALNWRDKSVMRALLRWDDVPAIRAFAGRAAATALAAAPDRQRIDIVQTVSRLVPLRVVQHCFGFPGPDDATMLRWSKATQADMFYNIADVPAIHEANVAAGNEMRSWIRDFIAQRQPWSELTAEDTVSRLLRLSAAGLSGLDAEGVVSNVCGLLVGAVETISLCIVNATEQILLRPEIAAKAIAAAAADAATFDSLVWEALRFNPETTFVVRVAAEAAVLAPGSDHESAVAPGRAIAVAIGSAMFDSGVFADPDVFMDRPPNTYIHMGLGQHECLGRCVAAAVVPETIRQILMLPGIHLLENAESTIDEAGGLFAEHFVLGAAPNGELAST